MIGKDKVGRPQKSSLPIRHHGSILVLSSALALHLSVAAIDSTQAMNIGFSGIPKVQTRTVPWSRDRLKDIFRSFESDARDTPGVPRAMTRL
jgi:hypothetical protein